jgi:hypothetical protein
LTLAPRQIGDRRIHSDADASEADHVDENPLQDLLLALDVDEGQAILGRFAFGWSRLGSLWAATLVRSICLDFFGPWAFPAKTRAMRVGFPWILSSESRLFNGLRGLKRGSFFLAFPWR